jgi:hypothetical protein
MKTYGGVEVQFQEYLASALDGGEWSASRPGRFTLGERASSIRWIGGWVGPRDALDAVAEKKYPCPCQEIEPRSSSPFVNIQGNSLSNSSVNNPKDM